MVLNVITQIFILGWALIFLILIVGFPLMLVHGFYQRRKFKRDAESAAARERYRQGLQNHTFPSDRALPIP